MKQYNLENPLRVNEEENHVYKETSKKEGEAPDAQNG